MIKYEDLVKYLIQLGQRHPNIELVSFGQDLEIINKPDFKTPALIISPVSAQMNEGSRMVYNFNLIYLDKLREEGDHHVMILEDSIHYMIGYLSVLDLEHQLNFPFDISPVLTDFDGGYMIGSQATISIENIYNIEKFKSVFYGNE